MPTINFKGKSAVWNHHLSVPYHTLEKDVKKSLKGKNDTENLIIEGDNLLALKSLLPKYQGKIKCIYIDPPYNTGNGGWVYNDNVNSPIIQSWVGKVVGKDGEDLTRHDKWLCMMTPRLKALRDLLSNDGVIFISIDDNEIEYLWALMNEIFEEKNFVACITVEGNPRGRDYGGVARMHDYLLVYKNSDLTEINDLLDPEKTFPYEDKKGGFEVRELRNRNIAFNINNRPNLYYPFYVNPKEKDSNGFLEISLDKNKDWVEVYPKESQGYKTVWRWGKEKAFENLNTEIIGKAMESGDGYQIVEKYRKKSKMARSIWTDKDVNTEKGTLLLKEIFGRKVFAYPKPAEMIMRIIEMGSNKGDIILDSFAGSGTTAHAVISQNLKDKLDRKFILVEMESYADKITAERIRKVIKKNKSDIGFSYLKLGSPIDADSILFGKLPSYSEFAKYVYYLATGETMDSEKIIDEKSYFVGKNKGESIYLIYQKDKEKLKNMAITLDWAETINKKDKEKKIVYAPACFLDEEYLEKFNIQFVSVPYNLFEKK
ncbi:MAG: site-specific DNA-methyltransferase [Candidatus Paceibacterota bacterium]